MTCISHSHAAIHLKQSFIVWHAHCEYSFSSMQSLTRYIQKPQPYHAGFEIITISWTTAASSDPAVRCDVIVHFFGSRPETVDLDKPFKRYTIKPCNISLFFSPLSIKSWYTWSLNYFNVKPFIVPTNTATGNNIITMYMNKYKYYHQSLDRKWAML